MTPALQQLYRESFGRLVASAARLTQDLPYAEDLVQDAFVKAADEWGNAPPPAHALAWLTTTSRNAALDSLRRTSRWAERTAELSRYLEQTSPEMSEHDPDQPVELADDMLRLIFTCCHPALHTEARVALCLNIVCGMSTTEVASAFITTEATMGQRLWRAKTKIRDANIPYRVPDASELDARLQSVLAVVYLIFNEGWLASSADTGLKMPLVNEAIRLGRLLCNLIPTAYDAQSLLALMLLQNSRRYARFSANGAMVLLPEQDRSLWQADEIAEAVQLLSRIFSAGFGESRYAILAAIASVHATAPTAGATDWPEIVRLYEFLRRLDPSPVVALNHAVAIAERDGPQAGLQMVEQLAEHAAMTRYHLFYATRAEFLHRLGKQQAAADDFQRAIQHCSNGVETKFLHERLALVQSKA